MSDQSSKPIDIGDIISPVLGIGAPAPTLGYGHAECWLHQPEVLPLARKVQCKRCRAALDPLDVLISLTRQAGYIECLRADKKRLEESIAELKHSEKLAKGRVKRAEAKDAAAAVAKERERLADMHLRLAFKAEEIGMLAEQIGGALAPMRRRRR